jgi:formylmethanofuran dehydrogenase subunit C
MRLKMKPPPSFPATAIEASSLCPDRMMELARRDIERLRLGPGRCEVAVGDLFEVSGVGGEAIEVEGDLAAFARVGALMSRGTLVIRGPVGPRAGSGMRGGTLLIEGSAGDYAGEGMIGGLLRVRGDAGDHLAAPFPGSARGMNRGTILIDGSAGRAAVRRMRRGLVAVRGDLGEGAACGMLAGSLFAFGRLRGGAGALMRRGTIVALGDATVLPTFLPAGFARFPFLDVFFNGLEAAGFPVMPRLRGTLYLRSVGDVSGGGVGEILTPGGPA